MMNVRDQKGKLTRNTGIRRNAVYVYFRVYPHELCKLLQNVLSNTNAWLDYTRIFQRTRWLYECKLE